VNTKNFGSIAGKNSNPGKPIQEKFHSIFKAKVQATTKYIWHQNYKYNSLANLPTNSLPNTQSAALEIMPKTGCIDGVSPLENHALSLL